MAATPDDVQDAVNAQDTPSPPVGALSALANPPASAEGKKYAKQIIEGALAGQAQSGEQSLFSSLEANAESARQMLRQAREKLMAQQISPQEQQLAQAAAWFAPSRTGNFSENVSNALQVAADQAKQQRLFKQAQQTQDFGLAGQLQDIDANMLNARLKLQEMHEQQQNSQVGPALRVLSQPDAKPNLSPVGKLVTDRLGPNALQTPEGKALFDKLLAQKNPGQGGTMGQQDIDLLADRYFETGQMPSMGMGKEAVALKEAIAHSATQRALGNRNAVADATGQGASAAMTGNAAINKATTTMLSDMTKRTAVADSSEETARKNLDLAYGLMTKADQTGSPLINGIQNKIRSGVLGDPDVSAYTNALTTAANEYARVISMATGAQGITDAARKEGHELFNPMLAPDQLKHNIDVAHQEMANRTASLHEQITGAKRGLYFGPKSSGETSSTASPSGVAEGTTATNKATGEKIVFRSGKWQPLQ